MRVVVPPPEAGPHPFAAADEAVARAVVERALARSVIARNRWDEAERRRHVDESWPWWAGKLAEGAIDAEGRWVRAADGV